jgi:crotonobetainyl-CoA:carnitine CoA-transferase CaiB-like acyl-CoA transferase
MTGTPIKMSRTPGQVKSLPPKYGEHSREILQQFGFSDTEIATLLASETVLEKRK